MKDSAEERVLGHLQVERLERINAFERLSQVVGVNNECVTVVHCRFLSVSANVRKSCQVCVQGYDSSASSFPSVTG